MVLIPDMDHNQFVDLIELLHQQRILAVADIAKHFSVDDNIALQWIESLNQFDNLLLTLDGDKATLNKTLDFLKCEIINQHLADEIQHGIADLSIHTSLSSTNEYLRKKVYSGEGALICLAEHQTSGRGRRGKQWISPFGQNIYLSLLTRCRTSNNSLGAVSLVVGIAVVEALKYLGVEQLKIKWPNDVYWQDQKLAGILIEAKEIREDYADLVIGVGLNVHMDEINASDINQSWTALNQILSTGVYRSLVAAQLIRHIILKIQLFEEKGFDAFMDLWQEYDYLVGKDVILSGVANTQTGVAKGINTKGELLLSTHEKTITINAGEVSVRIDRSGES